MPELQDTFHDLVDRHKKILYKICNSYSRNPDDREDLAQQIVIQLWRSFRSFDRRMLFSTWMYRVALNVAISWYRREKTRTTCILPAGEHLLDVAGAGRRTRMRPGFFTSSSRRWTNKALILLYLDGHTNREIGEVLGISETNVGTKISRLKTAMRQEFTGIGKRIGLEGLDMELDELRAKWAEHDRKLDLSIRLNRQLLRDNYAGRARFAPRRLAALPGFGIAPPACAHRFTRCVY